MHINIKKCIKMRHQVHTLEHHVLISKSLLIITGMSLPRTPVIFCTKYTKKKLKILMRLSEWLNGDTCVSLVTLMSPTTCGVMCMCHINRPLNQQEHPLVAVWSCHFMKDINAFLWHRGYTKFFFNYLESWIIHNINTLFEFKLIKLFLTRYLTKKIKTKHMKWYTPHE